jgi:hypothetical protein
MKRTKACCLVLILSVLMTIPQGTEAQEPKAQNTENKLREKTDAPEKPSDSGVQDREQRLAKYLTGAKFVGNFTVEGKSNNLPTPESYTISKCEKLPKPDMYRLTARIKYGDIDSEVPLDLKILWSGKTPVITMDSFWIPGMGTFGARVLIHSGRYAGTWQHDAVGGHLFGVIKKD